MSDTDVARTVEAASLKDMESMDIDNVYTLMDVQLGERPGPRELYQRWEKQNWESYAIDFTEDKQHWEALPDELKSELIFGLFAFFLGEAAVTDTLSPMVHAAPTDEDRQFLSTQLVDEARHTIFFDRFFREVVGVDGLEGARQVPEVERFVNPSERGYGILFYDVLPAVTDAVRLDPGDYGKWVDSIVLYHMLIEGMLALYGQRQLLQAARAFGVLPGFRSGFTAVTRDESRHVNYGVYALRIAIGRGLHDRIVDFTLDNMDPCCDLLTLQPDKIEVPSDEIRAMIPEQLQQQSFWEGWAFPIFQLRKRLRSAGIQAEALDRMEQRWWQRTTANVAEYEQTFGELHPASQEDPAIREKAVNGALEVA